MNRSLASALACACLATATGGSAMAQTLGGGTSVEIPFVRLAIGLVLCVMLALGAILVIRRMQRGGLLRTKLFSIPGAAPDSGRRVRVLETHRLSAHGDVCRLTSGEEEFLIVVTQAGATLLRTSPCAKPQAPAAGDPT